MAGLQLPAVVPFSVSIDRTTLGPRWAKWVKSLEYYMTASSITDKAQMRAMLLHLAGTEVQDVFETLSETGDDYKTALARLTQYFEPRKNISFERHKFRQACQGATESMDAFVTRLRELAKSCDFKTTAEEMIRDQIVDKCASNSLRRRFLRETDLTLDTILEIARAGEAADLHASKIESAPTQGSGQVNRVTSTRPKEHFPKSQTRGNARQHNNARNANTRRSVVCYCCGRPGHRAKDP